MPSHLSTFLAHVAASSKVQSAFQSDPAQAVNGVGLSAEAKAAILSKDPATIRDAILAERGIRPGVAAAGDTEVVIVVVL